MGPEYEVRELKGERVSPAETKRLVEKFGKLPVWGVISSFAADSFYGGLTYDIAFETMNAEAQQPGRDAILVLTVANRHGPEL